MLGIGRIKIVRNIIFALPWHINMPLSSTVDTPDKCVALWFDTEWRLGPSRPGYSHKCPIVIG